MREGKDSTTERVIGAAIEVHRVLGPGLLESVYCECLSYELTLRRIDHRREVPLHIHYRDLRLPVAGYRVDFVVEESTLVEVKSMERTGPLHRAQLLTYLRVGGYARGLLLNFGATRLRDGIHRVVNGWTP